MTDYSLPENLKTVSNDDAWQLLRLAKVYSEQLAAELASSEEKLLSLDDLFTKVDAYAKSIKDKELKYRLKEMNPKLVDALGRNIENTVGEAVVYIKRLVHETMKRLFTDAKSYDGMRFSEDSTQNDLANMIRNCMPDTSDKAVSPREIHFWMKKRGYDRESVRWTLMRLVNSYVVCMTGDWKLCTTDEYKNKKAEDKNEI